MIIEEYKAKSLVRTCSPSLFSWGEAYLNPYQGCYHNCKYCDGKSEGYYMHADFGERIRIKINAPQLFEQFLKKKGFIPLHREKTSTLVDFLPSKDSFQFHQPGKFIVHIGGGVCDVYQPAEKEIKITRKLLQITYDYKFPVFILTKNKFVLRDLDLLKKINGETYANVSFTITLADEKVQKIFEPRASTTQERFEAIKTLREESIHSGVYFYPNLPFIGDTDENMQAIYEQAKKVGAEFIYCWGLTLKPGRNKQEFFQTLEKHFPSLLPKYEKLYGNEDKYGNLDVAQAKEMGLSWQEVKGYKLGYEYGIPYAVKRYIPDGRIEKNLRLSEILRKMAFIKGFILQNSRSEVRRLTQASMFLEKFHHDISKLKKEELEKLPISKKIHPYVLEFVKENKSHYLEELEEKAYKTTSKEV
ncbi:MAG: radical SAM protein [Asgard group archaeon]